MLEVAGLRVTGGKLEAVSVHPSRVRGLGQCPIQSKVTTLLPS